MRKKVNKKIKILCIVLAAVVLVGAIVGVLLSLNSFGNSVKKASKNLTAYAIDATLNSDYTLDAVQTITYINNTGTNLDTICLHLYARAFREDATIRPYTNLNQASCFPNGISYGDIAISRVDVNENSANFEFVGEDADILQINLFDTLNKKEKIKIDIDFKLTLPNCTHRFGYYNSTINLGNWYPIVCAFIDGKWNTTPYYSTGDPFVSECANYSVNIAHPEDYNCYATGNKVAQHESKCEFSALAVRDFAVVLGNNFTEKSVNSGKTVVTYVGYANDSDMDANTQLSADAIAYYSKTFGAYPYKNLTVVKSAFVHGGMEYPNLVIVSDNITEPEEFQKVIIHEIAHQWWYALVGNNQITQAWLDESLAEYSTCLFYEDNPKYGVQYADQIKDATASYLLYVDVISSLNGKVKTSMNLSVNQYTSEYEYTYMIYVKGVVMFDSLREVVGKEKLIKALKKYLKTYSFKLASEQDFINIIKDVCHKDLDNFFEGWLGGTNVIGYVD